MIGATGRQGAAIAAVISESIVNLGGSIYLASRFGAIGVALGTLLGSAVSMIAHFAVTMRLTQPTITIRRGQLFLRGLMQPAMIAIPSLLLLPLWWSPARMTLSPGVAASWALATLASSWFCALNAKERDALIRLPKHRLMLPSSPY